MALGRIYWLQQSSLVTSKPESMIAGCGIPWPGFVGQQLTTSALVPNTHPSFTEFNSAI
jgi:hypothetical protein